jgi:hypothetical protein
MAAVIARIINGSEIIDNKLILDQDSVDVEKLFGLIEVEASKERKSFEIDKALLSLVLALQILLVFVLENPDYLAVVAVINISLFIAADSLLGTEYIFGLERLRDLERFIIDLPIFTILFVEGVDIPESERESFTADALVNFAFSEQLLLELNSVLIRADIQEIQGYTLERLKLDELLVDNEEALTALRVKYVEGKKE